MFSLKFSQRITVMQTESNQEVTKMTVKHAAEYSKTLCWDILIRVRCINYSYNNIARSVGLLDEIAIFVCTGKFSYK